MKKNKVAYLAGAMEYAPDEGFPWRHLLSSALRDINIESIIPNDVEEKLKMGYNIDKLKKTDITLYVEIMRSFIKADLELIESVDMVIVNWNGEKTSGTFHEVGYAYQLGKPCYLITSKPLCEVPGWFLSCFTKIFTNTSELTRYLTEDNVLFIIDIDGTVADSRGRIDKIIEKYGEDDEWPDRAVNEFLTPEALMSDELMSGAENILGLIAICKAKPIFLTGRNESAREVTRKWLTEKLNVPKDVPLFMRPLDAKGSSPVCKEQMFLTKVKAKYPNSTYIFLEDDLNVADRYCKYGLVLKSPECWEAIHEMFKR